MDFSVIENNLKSLGYSVACFSGKEDAANYLSEEIKGKTVGMGGSVTLKQMNLYDMLKKDNTVYWHWNLIEGEDLTSTRKKANAADVYISSVNGIAETGEIINIDGDCNRVAGIQYGHKKVFLVIGENKIATDYETALYRARNVAAPKNAQRLNKKTPCAVKADKCYNCKSPDRICKGLSVLWGAPCKANVEVLLIHEELGY